MAAAGSSSNNSDEFNEIAVDSDSDDDIPLSELRSLANLRKNDGSPGTRDDLEADRNDLDLDQQVEQQNGDGEEEEEEIGASNVDLSTAYDHDWLPEFNLDHGHKLGAGAEDLSEIALFCKIITPEIVDLFVTETNRYAEQYFVAHPKNTLPKFSLARKWYDTKTEEMSAFLGILYFMGYIKLSTYLSYWSTDYFCEMRGFRSIMSRDRFHSIWQFFHAANNENSRPRDHPLYDKLFKIRPLVDALIENWQAVYYPGKNLSVDESIVAFKGRASMIQYNPQKPHKWGMKAWVLAESKTGYIYNWELYRGASGNGETGLSHKVVMNITTPVHGNQHHIYMDNFFSSPTLFEELAGKELGACGTLRANRLGVPQRIKDSQKKLKKTDPPVFVRDGKLLYVAWQDKKPVNVITSLHNSETFEKTMRCKDAATNFQRKIIKPKTIELYNQHMGGVDLADQKLQVYLNIHRTVKWWKKLALYLLEASFVNALIIYRSLHPGEKVRADKFRLAIIHGLVANHTRHLPPTRHPDPPGRMVGRHWLGINKNVTAKGRQSYPDCVVCSDRSIQRDQTKHICQQCELPMCPYPCFERFHSLHVYRVPCSKELHNA
jgi:hypothetical protein